MFSYKLLNRPLCKARRLPSDRQTAQEHEYIHLHGATQPRHTPSHLPERQMHLRQAYADTLRLLRARKGLNQSDLASALDASHISRLESARTGVTLDSSESLAQTLKLHPLSLLVMAYAVKEEMTPGDALRVVTDELTALSYLDVKLTDEVPAPQHPLLTQGAKTRQAIQALKAQGVKKAEVAGRLGVSGATVRRYWDSADT